MELIFNALVKNLQIEIGQQNESIFECKKFLRVVFLQICLSYFMDKTANND